VAILSQVTKILIDPKTKKTTGVEFIKKGKLRTVYVRKEVILSAGPINSPQLLMLSGIGPRDHLKHHGIHVIQDLPVGKNLLEHYGTLGMFIFCRKCLNYFRVYGFHFFTKYI